MCVRDTPYILVSFVHHVLFIDALYSYMLQAPARLCSNLVLIVQTMSFVPTCTYTRCSVLGHPSPVNTD